MERASAIGGRSLDTRMNKENTLYGIIGLLIGVLVGYAGTNYLNGAPPTPAAATASNGQLPPGHPPTSENAPTGNASEGAEGGPQNDVTAAIQQARSEPSNFAAQMKAASLFSQINRPEGALEFYQAAYKVKPDDPELLTSLGNTNFDLSRYEEAEKWYAQSLKVKPDDATVRMDLGLTFYLRTPRNLDRAISEYQAALKIDPRHEKTLQNLTRALLEKGDKAAASATLKQLEAVNSQNTAISQFRSQLQ